MARIKNMILWIVGRVKLIFKKSVTHFFRAINPYKNVDYYRRYFDTYRKVAIQRDNEMYFLFKCYFTLMTYFALLNCAFYFIPPSLAIRLVFVDGVYILQIHRQFYILYAINICFSINLYWTFYIKNDSILNLVAENVFFGIKNNSTEKFIFYNFIFTRKKFVKISMIINNAFQVIIIFLDLILSVFMVILWKTFCKNNCYFFFDSFFNFFVLMPVFLFHLFCFFTFWCSVINVIIFLASFVFASFYYIISVFKLNYAKLKKLLKSRFQHRLRVALQRNIHLFELLFISNDFYKHLFLNFLIIYMPTSAYYIVQIFMGNVNGLMYYILLLFIFHSLTGSLAAHWGIKVFKNITFVF